MATKLNDTVAVGVASGVDKLYSGVLVAMQDSATGEGATVVLSAQTARELADDIARAATEVDGLPDPKIERVAVSSSRELLDKALRGARRHE